MSINNGQAKTKRTSRRWWSMMAAFVDLQMATLSPSATCVWFVLFRNSRDGVVTISRDQIAAATGQTVRTAGRKLRELVDADLVQIESRGRRNVGPTRYRLLSVSAGHQCPPEGIGQQDSGVPLKSASAGHRCPIEADEAAILNRTLVSPPQQDTGVTPFHEKEKAATGRPADACASRSDVGCQNGDAT